MILVDTSVWIDHFRKSDPKLELFLLEREILIHPFILGELSLGYLPKREEALTFLELQLSASPATDKEVLSWVEKHRLYGKGIGWVDAHLLLSSLLSHAEFWTHDKTLLSAAHSCGVKTPTHH